MATIKHECPHCRVKDLALVVQSFTKCKKPRAVAALMICPRCTLPSSCLIGHPQYDLAYLQKYVAGADPTESGWVVLEFWPEVPPPIVPELLPPDIERVYLQAESNFFIEGNEEASGTMYRKALDVAMKKIDPSLSGTLGVKLKTLAKSGELNAEIGSWAEQVRDLGNEATHEEQPIERTDLEDLRAFTEMTLRYLFTLPNMIRKRRGESLPWEKAALPASPAKS